MRDVVDIARRFRHALVRFRPSIKRNWWLRRALYLIEKWYCLLTCHGDPTTVTIAVTDEMTFLRYPDLFARETSISNTGTDSATIYEDGVIVGIVGAGKSAVFRFSNRFILDAICDTGDSTSLDVTTFRRCECGDVDPLPYGQVIDPVGGQLI